MQTTVGQILVNDALPPELRDYSRVLDKKGINQLLQTVATQHPEKYRDISHKLAQLGWRTSQEFGGYSAGLSHFSKSKYATKLREQLLRQLTPLLDDDSLDDKSREEAIVKLISSKTKEQQEQIYEESLKEKNPLAMQVLSGSRGNKMNLSSLRGSDMLYVDHHNRVIPIPILRSYSEGLTPAEYWAGSYGARKGVLDLKTATADAGYFAKQLNQMTHRLVVTDLDDETNQDDTIGMPVDVDDADNEGALLARAVGPYARNTVLTPKILKHISQLGHKHIAIRSPTVSVAREGIYARDAGVREHGNMPGRGEIVGMAAAQALAEPITQNMIGSKHTGGVAGEGKSISGFDYIDQLVQVPSHFKGGAAHSDVDGTVSQITPNPAGGHFVLIDGVKHFVPAEAALKVKVGDTVEAGDVISAGTPNPAKIVEHKGIGEGRRYFVDVFRSAMQDAGLKAHRRNVELLARGLINHVRLTEETDDGVPDDVVPYSSLAARYQPRKDAQTLSVDMAKGKYLERPVLHYSIGTPIRPSVQKRLNDFGIKNVVAHDKPPGFQPEMLRAASSVANDPDWMTRMYGSGLKRSLLQGVQRGATSNELGSSFVPGLARGVDFGRVGLVQQPQPGYPVPEIDTPKSKTFQVKAALFGSPPPQPPGPPAPPVAPPPRTPQSSGHPRPSPAGTPGMFRPATNLSGSSFYESSMPSTPNMSLAGMIAPFLGRLGTVGQLGMLGALGGSNLATLTSGAPQRLPVTPPPTAPRTPQSSGHPRPMVPPGTTPPATPPTQPPMQAQLVTQPTTGGFSGDDVANAISAGTTAWTAGKHVLKGAPLVAKGLMGKAVPLISTTVDIGQELGAGAQRGAEAGYTNPLAQMAVGAKLNNDDLITDNGNWNGVGGYARQVLNNAGRPTQTLIAGARNNPFALMDDAISLGIHSMISRQQAARQQMDQVPLQGRQRVLIPDPNVGWLERTLFEPQVYR